MTETIAPMLQPKDGREKRLVALSSVLAAVFLTSMKIVVGLLTGSLGILSEAAHSGLDLVAAAVTYFAVRISGRPADQSHTYGHGKVENLSALFETILLLLTCTWIIYEAIQRLFFKSVEVETSIWGFLVMTISIGIDYTRSRALTKVAKKYHSQALEADALHFSTDIWSSTVVIAGLGLVWVARTFKIEWLGHADAVAALGVALIVVYVSVELGKKTIADLLDEVPPGLRDSVQAAGRQVPGVLDVQRIRIRRAGPEIFADLTLIVGREASMEQAQRIATEAEKSARQVLTRGDVIVNIRQADRQPEDLLAAVRSIAASRELGVHGIRVYDIMGNNSLEMHVEVDDSLNLEQAHRLVTTFEDDLRAALPNMLQVTTHIEPTGENSATRQAASVDEQRLWQVLMELPEEIGIQCNPHDLQVHKVSGELSVAFHCNLDTEMPITDAHALTERIEAHIRARLPDLGRIVIHVEPKENPSAE